VTETDQTEDQTPETEAQQDVAQASDTKAEATSTAKASDELSEDNLEAVAGGTIVWSQGVLIYKP
jgi:hypothetical protein